MLVYQRVTTISSDQGQNSHGTFPKGDPLRPRPVFSQLERPGSSRRPTVDSCGEIFGTKILQIEYQRYYLYLDVFGCEVPFNRYIYISMYIYIYLSICIYIYVYIWWNIREICFYLYMEVSIVMGVRNSWMCVFFYWKIILKNGWFRGTPILGNLHVWICDISWYFYIFLSLMFSRLIFGTKTFDRFCSCIWI